MYYLVLYSVVGALIAWLIMYLDAKLLDNPKEKSDYLRGMLLTGAVVALLIAFIGEDLVGGRGGGMVGGGGEFGGVGYVAAIQEEILTGAPTF